MTCLGALAACCGCGGPSRKTVPVPSTLEEMPADEITIMHVDAGNKDFMEFIRQAEQELNMQIHIQEYPINADSRHAKISSLLAAGSTDVDIFSVNDEMISEFKHAGYLEPLQDDVMKEETAGAFPREYLRSMIMADGQIYSVPYMMEILALWVNDSYLKEAGLTDVKKPEDFQAFLDRDWGEGRYAYGGAWEKSYVYNEIGAFINLYGGDYYDWSNPKTREAIARMKDLILNGSSPQDQLLDQYEQLNQKFIDGRYGMVLMYSGTINTYLDAGAYGENQLHLAGLPDLGGCAVYMATWQYALNKASPHKEAAKRFLSYAASREGSISYAQLMNRMPAREDVIQEEALNISGFEQIKDYMQDARLMARPLPEKSMSYISDLGEAFQGYITGSTDLDTFCQQAQKLVNEYLPR